jgi:hypothetical protein
VVSDGESSGKSSDDLARRILFALYYNPMKPTVSAASDVPTRDELVLAIWGQQWPRLRRAFRFCTLSFADRSSGNAVFDLQFLPALGRVRSAQFKGAIDADRQDFVAPEWLDAAVADLREGADGSLRRFLRAAGSDVGGRESFAPLATLHALSLHFASDPSAVERAISILESTVSDDQGHAARSLITRAAASAADHLGQEGLQFVIRNFELIDRAEADAAAERVGRALWRIEPKAVFGMLSDPERTSIAERAIAVMPNPALIEGIASTPMHLIDLIELRPDLATEIAYWALPEASKQDLLNSIGARPDIAQGAIDAMIRSGQPLAREARATFGGDAVLQRLISFVDADPEAAARTTRAWLPFLVSDADAVARVLVEEAIGSFDTLEEIARTVGPDAVPNTIGEDPWLTAVRRISASVQRPYLASFLLARAFGRRSRSSAELVQSTFDLVYTTVESASLADDAWQLLDHRLYRSYWWPSWDKCRRILQTTVDMYLNREIDASFFLKITARDDVFAALVDTVANNYGGQRYLKSIKDRLTDSGAGGERIRMVKRALW